MQNKNERNENKIIIGDLKCTMDKMDRHGKNKTDFIGAVPIVPCENSLWIMGLRIYGEGRTQIPPDSIDRLPSKTKIGKDYVSPSSPQLQRLFFFY